MALIFGFGWLGHKAQKECEQSGGRWTVVGHHSVVTGKTVSVQPTYGCVR